MRFCDVKNLMAYKHRDLRVSMPFSIKGSARPSYIEDFKSFRIQQSPHSPKNIFSSLFSRIYFYRWKLIKITWRVVLVGDATLNSSLLLHDITGISHYPSNRWLIWKGETKNYIKWLQIRDIWLRAFEMENENFELIF